jgi:SAM-dependent methyltransferase
LDISPQIKAHYGHDDIYRRILTALRQADIDPATATIEDLAPIDQFHTGGLPATKALAERSEINSASQVFDAGCGIGGPARFLAKTYGCNVVGMDLADDFIEAAGPLNVLLGLADKVSCAVGDIATTGLDGDAFDVVWSQNVLMNIEDKAAALKEAHRILKPGGTLVMQAVMEDNPGARDYPVPWAPSADIDFLVTSADFQRTTTDAGFTITVWEESRAGPSRPPTSSTPSLNFSVIMRFPDFGVLMKNVFASAQRGLLIPVVAVLTK